MLGQEKRGPEGPLKVSPFKLDLLTARYFSACGLNVVRSERIRPVFAVPLERGDKATCVIPGNDPNRLW